MQTGMPIGTSLGFEPELIQKYDVSRGILRESISILERGGLVQMLRGRYGGLTVAATPEDAAVNSLQNYFSFVDYRSTTKIDQILLLRKLLEPIALRAAARLADDVDVAELRALENEVRNGKGSNVQNARSILRRLFRTCRNPALIIFIRVLNQLSVVIGLYQNIPRDELEEYSRQILDLRLPQIEALIAGDLQTLTELQFRQIELLRALHQRHRSADPASPPATLAAMRSIVDRLYEFTGIDRAPKQSDVVAQFLLYEMWRNGWPEGHNLGFEPELLRWIGTSKAPFREALRVLERMGLLKMATGRHGGLTVCAPDPEATLVSARMCLHALGVTPSHTHLLEQSLALASIDEAMRVLPLHSADDNLIAVLRAILQNKNWAKNPALHERQFRLALADHSGNPIISLMTRLTIGLFAEDDQPAQKPQPKHAINPAWFETIVAAMADGDVAMARRHMIYVQHALNTGLSGIPQHV